MLFQSFTALLLVSRVIATIAPTAPVASTECTGGKRCRIQWIDDGDAPAISDFGAVSVGLYVGSTYAQTQIQDFGIVRSPGKNMTISPVIDPKVGPNADFYFIKFISTDSNGKSATPLTAYSARFTLKGMTGQLSATASAQAVSAASSAVVTATSSSASPATAAVQAVSTSAVTSSISSAHAAHKVHGIFALFLSALVYVVLA